jgi:16S rRNA (cytidine1402-2'-O)-methyltransferase
VKSGRLILIPTPLVDDGPFSFEVIKLLSEAPEDAHFIFEDQKPARRRWLASGLARETIAKFHYINEHSAADELQTYIALIKQGHELYLMSDGGLPCIADPGVELVDLCHQNKLTVTSAPFDNAPILALALSGFKAPSFVFQGFLTTNKEQRKLALDQVARENRVQILMETPYRLERLLSELGEHPILRDRHCCLAMELNRESERVLRGRPHELLDQVRGQKLEFVLLLNQINSAR